MNSRPSERRRAPRAIADFPIQLTEPKGPAAARLKDLSTIGLCCTTSARFPEMTLLGIDLQLPGQPQRHAIQGAVVRCEPVRASKGSYEVAIFFTLIDAAAKAAVGAWVGKGAPA